MSASEQEKLLRIIESFGDSKVICVGDVMLDRFVYGDVSRISPEAPIPVFKETSEKIMLGGAGNVARNIASLGGHTCFVSVVGDDAVGHQIMGLVAEEESVEPYIFTEKGRISTQKHRFIASNQQLLRTDKEEISIISTQMQQKVHDIVEEMLAEYDILVLSDYAKGVLSPEVLISLIKVANRHDVPVIVDPKHTDYSVYKGATLVCPNMKEFVEASGCRSDESDVLLAAADSLLKMHQIDNILVTRGKDGMTAFQSGKDMQHFSARARDIFDVSGAGDTVMATLAVALAQKCSLGEAANLANMAAGIVVSRLGTAVVYRTELKTATHGFAEKLGQTKILPQAVAADMVSHWQSQGLSVGFTNGCFDVVHAGHIQLLKDAKAQCDRLVVAINSDASVRRLKGETRPINNETDRAILLATIEMVDAVVIFREDTPLDLLQTLRPTILMKGADYTKDQVVGAEFIESIGGRIELLPLKDGYSTTNILKKGA